MKCGNVPANGLEGMILRRGEHDMIIHPRVYLQIYMQVLQSWIVRNTFGDIPERIAAEGLEHSSLMWKDAGLVKYTNS